VVISAGIVERRFKIDDPVGAISVHGTCGALGLLSVGLFADGQYGVTGLFYGNFNQLLAQIIGIIVLVVWVVVTASIAFWILDKTVGLRATPEEETAGMDLSEHNLSAYPDQ
jgi:Amt family ammonium transporter